VARVEEVLELRQKFRRKSAYHAALHLAKEHPEYLHRDPPLGPIKPESFARRIGDKARRAEGRSPRSPYRAGVLFKELHVALARAMYALDEAYGKYREYGEEMGRRHRLNPGSISSTDGSPHGGFQAGSKDGKQKT
jgi:hypothetical protein